ncbi:hypothetical protein GIB67_004196, partial [Kingdonia uniflora]
PFSPPSFLLATLNFGFPPSHYPFSSFHDSLLNYLFMIQLEFWVIITVSLSRRIL